MQIISTFYVAVIANTSMTHSYRDQNFDISKAKHIPSLKFKRPFKVVHFEEEEALPGSLEEPSPTLMIMDVLGNLDADQKVVNSPEAEEEEEEGSTITSLHNAIEGEVQDTEVEEGKNTDDQGRKKLPTKKPRNQSRNKLRNMMRDKRRITISREVTERRRH